MIRLYWLVLRHSSAPVRPRREPHSQLYAPPSPPAPRASPLVLVSSFPRHDRSERTSSWVLLGPSMIVRRLRKTANVVLDVASLGREVERRRLEDERSVAENGGRHGLLGVSDGRKGCIDRDPFNAASAVERRGIAQGRRSFLSQNPTPPPHDGQATSGRQSVVGSRSLAVSNDTALRPWRVDVRSCWNARGRERASGRGSPRAS